MGAWFCEGKDCDAVIPGAHPIECGDEGWSMSDPMLCRACTAESALETVIALLDTTDPEVRREVYRQIERVRRACNFERSP